MKNIKYLIYIIVLFIVVIGVTNAASLSVSVNKKSVVVGSTVSVTVSASGADGWEYCLSYDTSLFSFVSSNSDKGGTCLQTGGILSGYSKVTFNLKAIKSGTATFTLRDVNMVGSDGQNISGVNIGRTTVTARTQAEIEASYSTNADLKSIEVVGYQLNPTFNKDTLEYSLEVENEIESVKINAFKADYRASITDIDEVKLSEGLNKFEITVTAEKGNKKVYVINITRKELNPIYVTLNGKKYSVVRKPEVLVAPTYYVSNTTMVQDTEVPAFTSEITDYTLVGLKDEDGNIKLYRYDGSFFTEYKQIANDGFVFIPESIPEMLDDFTVVKSIKIGDISVDSYNKEDSNSDFTLVYGKNAKNGESGWYQYDIKEGTFQRFQNNDIVKLQDDIRDYFLLVVIFALGLGLSILVIIVLLIMNSSIRKKNNKMYDMLERSQKEDIVEYNEEIQEETGIEEAPEEMEILEGHETELGFTKSTELSYDEIMQRFERISDSDYQDQRNEEEKKVKNTSKKEVKKNSKNVKKTAEKTTKSAKKKRKSE